MYIATNLNSFYFLKKKNYQFIIWFNEITLAPPPNNIIDTFKMSKKKKDLKSKKKLTSSKKLAQQRKLSLAKLKKKKLKLIN